MRSWRSYRTGLKLALWHSLLLFVVFHAQRANVLDPRDAALEVAGSEYQHLATFASSFWLVAIATATFSAVNERELRRRRVDLEGLAQLATELESAADQRAAAEVLLRNVCDAFGFARALVVMPVSDGEFWLAAAHRCASPQSALGRPESDSVLRRAVEDRATLLVSALDQKADAWLATVLPSAGNLVVVPLSAERRSVALLVAEHSLRPNSRIERRVVSMVERFADHAALALRSASLLEQLERMAATDGLTLIANRRTFDMTLEREISRARRTADTVSLIMLDIDNFKPLNDLHGHPTGDEILRQVASIIARHCRDFDTAARYGGEEFALILPGCPAHECFAIAERLREVIAASETIVTVTASAGVATFPNNATDARSPASGGRRVSLRVEASRTRPRHAVEAGSADRRHLGARRVLVATNPAFRVTPIWGTGGATGLPMKERPRTNGPCTGETNAVFAHASEAA